MSLRVSQKSLLFEEIEFGGMNLVSVNYISSIDKPADFEMQIPSVVYA